MKRLILIVFCVAAVPAGCSLFSSSPSAVVKKYMSAVESDDLDTAVSLWGGAAVKEQGAAKFRTDAQNFAQMIRAARAGGRIAKIENMREAIRGDQAQVFFLYRASPENSVELGFALLKENGRWTLYRAIDMSYESQPFDNSFAPLESVRKPTPDKSSSPTEMVSPPPPPGATRRAPNLGGVLNPKATSLPQPPYPPIARAAKAAGTVVVQVTVDEDGKVISAQAVSGHPLLKAAAEAAARQARFNPTIVAGQRVKVTGAVVYEFKAP